MRSLLFIPADSERKLAKGRGSGADVLILDLEDSVAAARRPLARKLAAAFLEEARIPAQRVYVRINPLTSGVALDDLAAVVPAKPDGIMIPKSTPEGSRTLDHYLSAFEASAGTPLGSTRVISIATETPDAIFGLGGYKGASPRLEGLTWGAEDLAAALGADNRIAGGGYGDVFRLARALCILAAGAAGVAPIDTVYTNFRDEKGLSAECAAARHAGFVAKLAIHPNQVSIIDDAFSATAEELIWAERVVAAFADNPDAGAVGIEGKMIDRPHLALAKCILVRGNRKV